MMITDIRSNMTAIGGVRNGDQVRACNCIGPQNGDPVCPCMMPAYCEREAGKRALDLLGELYRTGKPRIRVPCLTRRID